MENASALRGSDEGPRTIARPGFSPPLELASVPSAPPDGGEPGRLRGQAIDRDTPSPVDPPRKCLQLGLTSIGCPNKNFRLEPSMPRG